MHISRFLPGISIILLSLICSCNDAENNSKGIAEQLRHPDDYSQRVNNIFAYVHKAGFEINFDNCNSIYILQPNLCNVCTEKTLKSILDSAKLQSNSVVFILADKNEAFEMQIRSSQKDTKVFADTTDLLEKFNLSFLKNLQIQTCGKRIVSWSFR